MSVRDVINRGVEQVPPGPAAAALRGLVALPPALRRPLAGRPIILDGQRLDPTVQLLLRLQDKAGLGMVDGHPDSSRALLRRSMDLVGGPRIEPVEVHDRSVPGAVGPRRARFYRPAGLADGSPLLLFLHGGGWVIGDVDTHDATCRLLALHAGVRVLSVEYRLAPEDPFPAAPDDCLAAYRWVREHAEKLGADPASIAIGGDSAGGNLAAVTALGARDSGLDVPAFLLLIYPAVDASRRRRSRTVFGEGFLLTDADIDWFLGHYAPDHDGRRDPRVSPLLADLAGMPPTYVTTAGFDPLRDEGEEFVDALRAAGVPVVLRRHPDLIHGFAGILGVGTRCREATVEAASALRVGLAL